MTLFKTLLLAGIISGTGVSVHAAEQQRDRQVAVIHATGNLPCARVPSHRCSAEQVHRRLQAGQE
jgi:hypothetical protein